ncbi:hypothetical protein BpHYR1_046291 [Brachionus plicatilis]|uniref:Uncharacterized protein n=1 Tax=Brachionus plicatilis TaxID=10195 RepID=A0A3M7RY24_BRAPC|nr:hypothetical protein BpHYR1_046291 [Brachionus plicatilis]
MYYNKVWKVLNILLIAYEVQSHTLKNLSKEPDIKYRLLRLVRHDTASECPFIVMFKSPDLFHTFIMPFECPLTKFPFFKTAKLVTELSDELNSLTNLSFSISHNLMLPSFDPLTKLLYSRAKTQ